MKFIKKIYNTIFLIILVPFILLQTVLNLIYSLLVVVIAVIAFLIWLLNIPMSQKVLEVIKFNTLIHINQKNKLEFKEREGKIKEIDNQDEEINKQMKDLIEKLTKQKK